MFGISEVFVGVSIARLTGYDMAKMSRKINILLVVLLNKRHPSLNSK